MVPCYMELQIQRAWYIPNMEYIYTFFLPTLDGLASILQTKESMNFLRSVLLTVKMGLGFSLFIATSLSVSKTDPGELGSGCKICEMLPLLSQNILCHHILTSSRPWKNPASAFQNLCHPGYDENVFFRPSFNLNYLGI